jgi:hypothetical protein
VDLSKVHISLAQIFKQLADTVSAFHHYEQATECINRTNDLKECSEELSRAVREMKELSLN